ncbi:coagulation factor IIIa isoform X2 [Hemiscyllium ocellatum]|uniref:coagulation factor IIIa isoform X2 n=1 Tax=Hemiscyllium ocellatum TaxID=170820 RepID=UPI00296758F3|nr:coagulation factor IIIa isoform X2 [Hemiscyllium ocellatum]
MESRASSVISLGFAIICLRCGFTSGTSQQPVTNLTWTSFNFHTVLQWEGTLKNTVYTVKLRRNSDWDRKSECTRQKITSCDLTSLIQNVTETYFAEVETYSEEFTEEINEPPAATSSPFQPLKDTDIGEASFKIFKKSKDEVKVLIEDPLTGIKFPNMTSKALRDIYGTNLKYKVFYWKDGTSGQKTQTNNNQTILIKIDKGINYCFSVQIHITSPFKNGPKSQSRCTDLKTPEYGLGFYALIAVGALLVISIIIGVTVCLCRRKAVHNSAETNPLKTMST